jgi:hypothetical protein
MPPRKSSRRKTSSRSGVRKSAKRRSSTQSSSQAITVRQNHSAFWPLLIFSLILWVIYRSIFTFPVWFDETLGKAIFFGLPVWAYAAIGGTKSIARTFDLTKIKRGMSLGLAVGGTFGFAAALLALVQKGGGVQSLALYSSDVFWGEFLLALLTGFWETLFFYSFVMTVIIEKYRKWPVTHQVLLAAVIFLVFHVPNSILRFSGVEVMYQVLLMLLFGIGQGYFFASERNGYALVLSQAIWGMVLLVHF